MTEIKPLKDQTKGAQNRTSPGARMIGQPPVPGYQRAESPQERMERLRRIARGEKP